MLASVWPGHSVGLNVMALASGSYWRASDLEPGGEGRRWKVSRQGMPFGEFRLPMAGEHVCVCVCVCGGGGGGGGGVCVYIYIYIYTR